MERDEDDNESVRNSFSFFTYPVIVVNFAYNNSLSFFRHHHPQKLLP